MAGVRALFDRACTAGQSVNADPARALPQPVRGLSTTAGVTKITAGARSMGAGGKKSADDVWDWLKRLERRALAGDRRMKKALGLSFHEAKGVRALVSTLGMAMVEPWSAVSFSLRNFRGVGDRNGNRLGIHRKTDWGRLNPEKVVEDVRARLLTSFGAKPFVRDRGPLFLIPGWGWIWWNFFPRRFWGTRPKRGDRFWRGVWVKKWRRRCFDRCR
jgi:predicted Zn-dependent protease